MNKDIAAKKDTKVICSDSKQVADITYIVSKDNQLILDDGWIKRLYAWADENNISSEDLPRDEYKLLSLEYLDLGDKEGDGYLLDNIPEEIGKLQNLTYLSLCFNGESCIELPETIGNLTNLTELLIYVYCPSNGCEIRMPKSMEDLTELTLISLSGNIPSTSIGILLENCESLRRLYIDNNRILKTLPNNIYYCSSMKELVLINNKSLLLTPKQFEWAIKLRDDEEGWDKVYVFISPDGALKSYTTDYGQKFRYYSIISWDN